MCGRDWECGDASGGEVSRVRWRYKVYSTVPRRAGADYLSSLTNATRHTQDSGHRLITGRWTHRTTRLAPSRARTPYHVDLSDNLNSRVLVITERMCTLAPPCVANRKCGTANNPQHVTKQHVELTPSAGMSVPTRTNTTSDRRAFLNVCHPLPYPHHPHRCDCPLWQTYSSSQKMVAKTTKEDKKKSKSPRCKRV